ncbi:MAG TPA: carbohydrate-binding protein, partial [Polyangia bacterium]
PTIGATNGGAGSGNSAGTGYGLTFVFLDPKSGSPGSPTPAIYVGVGVLDGTTLYRSLDAGATWEAIAGQPPAGMMPHHAVPDGCGNLYLTYNSGSGPNNVTSGAVWRYNLTSGVWTLVSPPGSKGGFGGIAADSAHPGTLIVTTLDRWPDEIYRTTNSGASWAAIGPGAQRDVAGAAWLWWHSSNVSATGWMGDVEIDPFNPAHVLYITGQGIWSSNDVIAADTGAPTHWSFADDGLEETVVLDLASPPAGAPLLSGVGDIAGFRHADLDVSPSGGFFDNPKFGNTTSLDFAEGAPNIVARVGTSSSGGQSGAYSTDGGTTWIPFASAPAGSKGSGSIAVSADGATLVWAPQGATPSYSQDSGAIWHACGGLAAGAKVAADRVNPLKFYASDRTGMYASTDGGVTFVKVAASPSGRPRPVFGIEGDIWVATSSSLFHSQNSAATFVQVPQVSGATAVGFGMPAPGQSYPAVFLAGSVSGVWGTYRSDDAGATWQRVDDPQHQFGYINCLTGDQRSYGRVYLGTGGRGILYGDLR